MRRWLSEGRWRSRRVSFGGRRVVLGRRSLLVEVVDLVFVHLLHHGPLQLHGRTCWTSKE